MVFCCVQPVRSCIDEAPAPRARSARHGISSRGLTRCVFALGLGSLLTACGGGGDGDGAAPAPSPPQTAIVGPAWWQFGRDAQHSAIAETATQPLTRIVWRTPVDLAPQYTANGSLLIHYGSPVITARNTVIVPVKTGPAGRFRIEARSGASGALTWSAASDYVFPAHDWKPSFNPALTNANRVYMPGAGGKLLFRDDADAAAGSLQTVVFYGAAMYAAASAAYDATVFINTPLTTDPDGTVYFGFSVTGTNSAGLRSGIARVAADGTGTWVAAATASGNPAIAKVAMNSAPALSADGQTLYVAVSTNAVTPARPGGYLLALDARTLATRGQVLLTDPKNGGLAWLSDNGTASPTVGPDGDVYYGVLESNTPSHNFRGWLLHFDRTLTVQKTPASFGWDDTPSIVPVSMIPSYTGPSAYLLAIKYNNYGGVGTGDGKNRMAIVDPNQTQSDGISAIPVMMEILTILGPTSDPAYAGGVKEWCINTAAVDPVTRSIMVNSEDGILYRWHLPSNTFTEQVVLTSGYAESYTPTAIGPDGAVYAINNAVLFSLGR
jgi:hypothetical protein